MAEKKISPCARGASYFFRKTKAGKLSRVVCPTHRWKERLERRKVTAKGREEIAEARAKKKIYRMAPAGAAVVTGAGAFTLAGGGRAIRGVRKKVTAVVVKTRFMRSGAGKAIKSLAEKEFGKAESRKQLLRIMKSIARQVPRYRKYLKFL